MWRYRVAMIGALALSGCANNPPWPVTTETLPEAVQHLNARLAKVTLINEADLLSDDRGYRFDAIRKMFRDKQCSSGVANPVLLIARPTKINLRGNLGEKAEAKPSGAESGESGGAAKTAPENSFEIPLRISTIADLPNEYLKDMVALLDTKGLPAEIADKLKKETPGNYEKLTARVDRLISEFNPAVCAMLARQKKALETDWSAIIFVPPTF
jgi:hypothetical protein